MQPTRNDLTKNQSQRRRAAFSISAPKRDAKPGLEPLRDGDDVNLASESEEFGGANAKDMGAQTKAGARTPDMGAQTKAGARTPGNQKSRPFSRESMQKTTSSGTKEGNQVRVPDCPRIAAHCRMHSLLHNRSTSHVSGYIVIDSRSHSTLERYGQMVPNAEQYSLRMNPPPFDDETTTTKNPPNLKDLCN
ncbi:hypothetical protein COOONC_02158 [Cooperia oncophora]